MQGRGDGMGLDTLALFFCVSVSVGAVAWVFLYPTLSGAARAEKRKQELISTNAVERVTARASQTSRRDTVAQSLKEIENREKARTKVTLEIKIAQAGLKITRLKFFLISAVVGILVGFVTLSLAGNPLVALSAAFAGGLGVPQWFLSRLRNRRIAKFVNEFPNAMDVIVRGVKAGLPLGDCLRIIANEAAEPVRTEFRQIVEAQTLGISAPDAAVKLYDRVPIPEANFFGIVLQIQSKSGGNLAEALGNLSRVLRERKKMKGKIQAMSMEAKASAAIIAILPVAVAMMLSVSSPKYLQLLYTTQAGQLWLAASAVWMFIGVMVMRKMINFDI